jgi:Skp family chaperone for outer membrane proteins
MKMETHERKGIRWYEVVYVVVLIALLAASVYFMNPHRVGVLDVNRVARDVKIYERIAQADKAHQEQAVANLTQLQQAHAKRMEEFNKRLKAAPAEAKDGIRAEMEAAQSAFQEKTGAIRQEVQRHQALMIATFRKRLQPFIDETARKRKLDVVLDPTVGLTYVRSRSDITDAVIKKCRSYFSQNLPLIDPQLAQQAAATNAASKPAATPAKKR